MKSQMQLKSIIITMITILLLGIFIGNISLASNTGKITATTANLRREANTSSSIIEIISAGETVEIIESSNGWTKVKHNNLIGYVRSDLVSTSESTTTTENTTSTTENNINSTETSTTANNTETLTNVENTTNTENTTNENNVTSETTENITAEGNTNLNETDTNSANSTNVQNNVETITIGKNKIKEKTTSKIIPLINAMDSIIVETNTDVEVTEIINNWAKIKTTDGKEGWVVIEKIETPQTNDDNSQTTQATEQPAEEQAQNEAQENVQTENEATNQTAEQTSKTMYVNVQTANLREQANSTSKAVTQLKLNTEVTVKSTENGWSKIETNGKSGYILSSLLSDTKATTTSRSSINERETSSEATSENKEDTSNNLTTSKSENTTQTTTSVEQSANTSSSSTSTTGNEVIAYSKQYLGNKYVMGGTTPSGGFDCSGFTQYVYKHFGISINRTAAAQYSNGKHVTDLQAGDLVMFGPNGISHVGIYIGGGTFIHAANPSRGVTTDTLLSGYYKTHYVGARRIL